MTDEKAPETKKPAGAAVQQQVKICPILTAANLRPPEPARVLGIAGQKAAPQAPDAVACQGPVCAFFLPIMDGAGRIAGGNCCIALIPSAVSMLNETVRAVTSIPEAKS